MIADDEFEAHIKRSLVARGVKPEHADELYVLVDREHQIDRFARAMRDPVKLQAGLERARAKLAKYDVAPAVSVAATTHDAPSLVAVASPPRSSTVDGCTVVCLADVAPKRIDWLWPGRIARGAITLIDGEPGKGKGCIMCDLAARVTRGDAMPYDDLGSTVAPADVVIMSAEDTLDTVIRPRLDVARADTRRVHAIIAMPRPNDPNAPPSLAPDTLARLEAEVVCCGAKLVWIDPLMAFLPANVDAHKDQDIRRVLTPLARLAERTGAAFVIIRHPRKGDGSAVHRGGGSIGIAGAARSVLFVGDDPDNAEARVIVGAKENNSRRAPGLRFRVEGAPHPEVGEAPRVVWLGLAPDVTADQLAATAATGNKNKVDNAIAALRDVLADGPMPSERAVAEVCAYAECSVPTVRRAMKRLGIDPVPVKDGRGKITGWTWSLPACQTSDADQLECDSVGKVATTRPNHEATPGDHDLVINGHYLGRDRVAP